MISNQSLDPYVDKLYQTKAKNESAGIFLYKTWIPETFLNLKSSSIS